MVISGRAASTPCSPPLDDRSGGVARDTTAMACLNARPQGIFFTGTRRVEITSGGKTRTETVTGGLMVDETATVAVHDTDGTRLPLVDVRTDLPRIPYPQF